MALPLVTYFDFADLNYTSYFLHGFEMAAEQGGCRLRISRATPGALQAPWIEDTRWRRLLFSVALFEYEHRDMRRTFVIDTRDSSQPGEQQGDGYHLPLLRSAHCYFKVNHNPTHLATTAITADDAAKIHSLPLFFPVRPRRMLLLLRGLIPHPELGWTATHARNRLRMLPRLPRMTWLMRLRDTHKAGDVFFLSRYYGEPAHAIQMERRKDLVERLRAIPNASIHAGFSLNTHAPAEIERLALPGHALPNYLRRLAAAQVAIYLRGMFDCQSFKLGQLLALGLPVAGQPILNSRDWFAELPNRDEQFGYESPAELADAVQCRLAHRPQSAELGRANAAFFDQHLTPIALARHLLDTLARG